MGKNRYTKAHYRRTKEANWKRYVGRIVDAKYMPKDKVAPFKVLMKYMQAQMGVVEACEYIGISTPVWYHAMNERLLTTEAARKIIEAHRRLKSKGEQSDD